MDFGVMGWIFQDGREERAKIYQDASKRKESGWQVGKGLQCAKTR